MKAKYNNEISRIVFDKTKLDMGAFNLRYKEHNKRYLKQCLYNLQEKYDRGIINESEWKKIKKIFRRKIK